MSDRAHGRGDAKLWRFLSVLYCSHDAVRPLLNPLYQIAVHCLIWFGLKSQSGRGETINKRADEADMVWFRFGCVVDWFIGICYLARARLALGSYGRRGLRAR